MADFKEKMEMTGRSTLGENVTLMLGVLSAIAAVPAFYISRWLPADGFLVPAFLFATTFFTCLISWMHARIEGFAAEEILAERTADKKKGNIFEEGASFYGDRTRTWDQFEKWFVPGLTALLAAFEGWIAYFLTTKLKDITEISPVEAPGFSLGLVLAMGTAAFLFFIAGKYAAGLAYKGGRRHLRAPASLTVFSAFYIGFVIVALLVSYNAVSNESVSWRNPEPALLYSGIVIFAAFALQHLLALLFSYYKPKTSRAATVPMYENRVAGFFSNPEGLWGSFTEMIDYQFGFKVSQTGFYNFILKALLPLVLFQLVALMLISCVVIVPGGKRAFCERWGKLRGEPLTPGIHFKLPWPVETVYYSQADLIMSFSVGAYQEKPQTEKRKIDSSFWFDLSEDSPLYVTAKKTDQAQGGKPLVTGKNISAPVVNLLAARANVQYQISDPQNFYYGHVTPEETLRKIAQKEFIAYLASHDGLELIQGSCADLNVTVCGELQKACDNLKMGVKIMSFAVDRIQPPLKDDTAQVFHETMIRRQKAQTMIFEAEKYKNELIPKAQSDAEKIISEAKIYSTDKLCSIEADTEIFKVKVKLYSKYGRLFSTLAYLDKLQTALKKPKKIVVASEAASQVLSFDLKSDFNPELLDMVNTEKTEK